MTTTMIIVTSVASGMWFVASWAVFFHYFAEYSELEFWKWGWSPSFYFRRLNTFGYAFWMLFLLPVYIITYLLLAWPIRFLIKITSKRRILKDDAK